MANEDTLALCKYCSYAIYWHVERKQWVHQKTERSLCASYTIGQGMTAEPTIHGAARRPDVVTPFIKRPSVDVYENGKWVYTVEFRKKRHAAIFHKYLNLSRTFTGVRNY